MMLLVSRRRLQEGFHITTAHNGYVTVTVQLGMQVCVHVLYVRFCVYAFVCMYDACMYVCMYVCMYDASFTHLLSAPDFATHPPTCCTCVQCDGLLLLLLCMYVCVCMYAFICIYICMHMYVCNVF